jgi:hypothetical protein
MDVDDVKTFAKHQKEATCPPQSLGAQINGIPGGCAYWRQHGTLSEFENALLSPPNSILVFSSVTCLPLGCLLTVLS